MESFTRLWFAEGLAAGRGPFLVTVTLVLASLGLLENSPWQLASARAVVSTFLNVVTL